MRGDGPVDVLSTCRAAIFRFEGVGKRAGRGTAAGTGTARATVPLMTPTRSTNSEPHGASGEPGPELVLPGSRDPRDLARAIPPGARGYSREEIATLQRERLIDAVVQVVAEFGYEQTGVKAIAERAGVGLNTFYEHFDSKLALCLAAYDCGVASLFEAVSAAFSAGSGRAWRDRIQSGLQALLRGLAQNPDFARYFSVEIHKAGSEGQARVFEAFSAAAVMFERVEPVPGSPIPALHLVPLVVGGVYTRLYYYIAIGKTNRLPSLVPVLTEFAVAVFGPAQAKTVNLTRRPSGTGRLANRERRNRMGTRRQGGSSHSST